MRALIIDPKLLILDEPFAAIDYERTLLLRATVAQIINKLSLTVLLISHDLDEAVLLGDRIFFLSKPPTRVHAEQLIPLKHPRSLELMTSNDFHQMKSEALTIFQASIAEKY